MKNVQLKTEGNILTLTVDLGEVVGKTRKGLPQIATTCGTKGEPFTLEGTDLDFQVALNVWQIP